MDSFRSCYEIAMRDGFALYRATSQESADEMAAKGRQVSQ